MQPGKVGVRSHSLQHGKIDVGCSTSYLEHRLEAMEAMVQSLRANSRHSTSKGPETAQLLPLGFSDSANNDMDGSSHTQTGPKEGLTCDEEAFYGEKRPSYLAVFLRCFLD
jgi:hypothetical protein